jgi:hypothetical protein
MNGWDINFGIKFPFKEANMIVYVIGTFVTGTEKEMEGDNVECLGADGKLISCRNEVLG